MEKLKDFFNKTVVIESCSRERTSITWRFYNLTNSTVFAALLRDVPMGCKNAVSPKPPLKNCTINCLMYEENSRQPYNDNLCLFRVLALLLHGNQRLQEIQSKNFNSFINRLDGLSPNQFKRDHLKDIPIVQDLLTLNSLLYDIDFVDGNIIGELARRSVQKYDKTVRLLRYKNHICYVSNINAVFQSFWCPNCDTFFIIQFGPTFYYMQWTGENVYPKNVYQTQKTLLDKLDSFGIDNTNEQTLFNNLAIFHFESICVQEDNLKDTHTTKWIGEQISISVFISSILVKEPIFFATLIFIISLLLLSVLLTN